VTPEADSFPERHRKLNVEPVYHDHLVSVSDRSLELLSKETTCGMLWDPWMRVGLTVSTR
jgi:hypothetical protein